MTKLPTVFQKKEKWYFTLEDRLFGPFDTEEIAENNALFWDREFLVHGRLKNENG